MKVMAGALVVNAFKNRQATSNKEGRIAEQHQEEQ